MAIIDPCCLCTTPWHDRVDWCQCMCHDNPVAVRQPLPLPASGDIQKLVIGDLEARREFGVKKYGTPLQAFNGRDALMDAYQEALDLVVYIRQVIEERDGPN
jgi:hypothetical protein